MSTLTHCTQPSHTSPSTSAAPLPHDRPQNLMLTNLPHEIQAMIFRQLYPRSPMILLPPSDPHDTPSPAHPFTYVNCPSASLLRTSSAVCAIAKPVRDASFSGTLIATSSKDVMWSGAWLHDNVRVLKIVSQSGVDWVEPPRTAMGQVEDEEERRKRLENRLHVELFSRLQRVEIVRGGVKQISAEDFPSIAHHPDIASGDGRGLSILMSARHDTFVADAMKVHKRLFYNPARWGRKGKITTVTPDDLEVVLKRSPIKASFSITVRLRYTAPAYITPENPRIVVGVVVRFRNGLGSVVQKIVRTELSPTPDTDTNTNANASSDADQKPKALSSRFDIYDEPEHVPIKDETSDDEIEYTYEEPTRSFIAAPHEIPDEYAWVRFEDEEVQIEDVYD